jgi:hypothetical protein
MAVPQLEALRKAMGFELEAGDGMGHCDDT